MVVLDSTGTMISHTSASTPPIGVSYQSYQPMQYVQPLQSEFDEKCDPLAMLTRACNKIETDLMKSNAEHKSNRAKLSLESPRSSTTSDRPESSSPFNNKRAPSTSPIDYKVRPPSNENRLSKRPSSANSTSPLSPSSSKMSRPSTSSSRAPQAVTSSSASPKLSTPPSHTCTDPMCRDPSCPTTAARNAHFLNFFAGARVNPYLFPPTTSPLSSPSQAVTTPTTSGSNSTVANSASSIGGSSPYVCSWMSGSEVCGRRFSTSDDLMAHVKSHTTVAAASASPSSSAQAPSSTSSLPSPADTLAALQAAQLQALYPALSSQQSALAALQARAVSAAAASSLSPSSQRFHPYMRPAGLGLPPSGLPAGLSPFGHLPPPAMPPFSGVPPFLPYGLPPFPYP